MGPCHHHYTTLVILGFDPRMTSMVEKTTGIVEGVRSGGVTLL